MKIQRMLCFLFVFYSLEKCCAQNEVFQEDTVKEISYHADSLIEFANKFIGVPYKAKGKTPAGFDCSGFSYYCFKNYGVNLPFSAPEQAKIGKVISKEEAEAGDLIF